MLWRTEKYAALRASWPTAGRHVLASYDADSLVLYQAYNPSIARAAVQEQRLGGGGWKPDRMSWVKPNFLWMMYRCGWATKPEQERVLGLRVRRAAFDAWLAEAVHSKHVPEVYGSSAAWEREVKTSRVRLQWDPDHAPGGAPVERRALQLGLRGAALAELASSALLEVRDLTDFAHEQRARRDDEGHAALELPAERVYPVEDPAVRARLGLDRAAEG